ncbi:MAG TPA: hypothetical protein VNX21_02960 [Candidatus Thermoplasmatota archaeon]|nr:hypothetical protein [Candidatus Thermoplasmatota archaeon]
MLSVKYGSDVPRAMADLLEHHARRAGLSLDALEVIGASLDFVEAFIVASEDEKVPEFLARVGLGAPRGKVELARWQARRLFGVRA